jgi:hypothetical protein
MNFPLYQNNTAGLGALQGTPSNQFGGQGFAAGGITALASGGLPKYKYDPVTQRYTLQTETPAATDPALEELIARQNAGKSSSSSSYTGPREPSFTESMTPEELRAFYDQNPIQADITSAANKLFGLTGLGMLQAKLNPGLIEKMQYALRMGDYSPSIVPALPGVDVVTDANGIRQVVGLPVDTTTLAGILAASGGPQTPYQPNPQVSDQPIDQRPEAGGPITYGSTSGYTPAPASEPGYYGSYSESSDSVSSALAAGGLTALAAGGEAGGQYNLGSYSDGGRLLKGPGDGVSDSIPAVIGHGQPARLANNEFVIPARIVSELGNGSTDAGARQLYAMMDRIQAGRKKTIGKNKVAVDSKAVKHLPA